MFTPTWGQSLQDALVPDHGLGAYTAVSPGRRAAAAGAFYAVAPGYYSQAVAPAYVSGAAVYHNHVLGHVFAAELCDDAWLRGSAAELARRHGLVEARLVRLDSTYFLLTHRA